MPTAPTIVSIPPQILNKQLGTYSHIAVQVSGVTAGATNTLNFTGGLASTFNLLNTITVSTQTPGTVWVIGFLQGSVSPSSYEGAVTVPDPELTVTVTSGTNPPTPPSTAPSIVIANATL